MARPTPPKILLPLVGWAALALGLPTSPLDLDVVSVTTQDASPNSTVETANTTLYIPAVKGVDTCLAVVAIVLIASTYYTLIRRTSTASSINSLPVKALAANLKLILEKTWNKSVLNPFLYESAYPRYGVRAGPSDIRPYPLGSLCNQPPVLLGVDENPSTRRLVYLGHNSEKIIARGYDELESGDIGSNSKPIFPVSTESNAGKNAINLAIWEWISLWLVIIMITNTAVYNGFTTNDVNPDRFPRLTLTIIYGTVFLLHFAYTWSCFCRAYTGLVLNGCWTILGDARFAISKSTIDNPNIALIRHPITTMEISDQEVEKLTTLDIYDIPLLGPTRLADSYGLDRRGVIDAFQESDTGLVQFKLQKRQETVGDTQMAIRSMQEAEIKTFEKATEAALDRILFNASILLSVSIVTGFSTWTQSQLRDATSTQLGSLALLASVGSGIGALLSSALHLGNAKSSPWRVLELTETMVSGKTRPVGESPDIGFTRSWGEVSHQVNMWSLLGTLRVSQIPMAILFGPAYVLLPSPSDDIASGTVVGSQLIVQIGGTRLLFHYERHGEFMDNVRLAVDHGQPAEPPASSFKGKENAADTSNQNVGDQNTVLRNDAPDVEDGVSSGPK